MLNDLVTLAKETTQDARRELLQRVADVFLDGVGAHSPAELELFCDILLTLLDKTPLKDRVKLSQRIAPTKETPRPIAYRLASDTLPVAAPMLEFSPSLTQSDLIRLARRMPQKHLEALAKRSNISMQVSDLLVERGELGVWRAVAANDKVRISTWAMRSLTHNAISDKLLRETMAQRGDLTPTICEWLLPHVEETTRQKLQALLNGGPAQPGGGEQALADTQDVRQSLRKRLGIYIDNCDVRRLARLIERRDLSLDEVVPVLLEDNRTGDAMILLARAAGLPIHNAHKVLFEAKLEELLEMSLKAEVTNATFLALALARCKQLRFPETQAKHWLALFQRQRSIRSAAAAVQFAQNPKNPRPAS